MKEKLADPVQAAPQMSSRTADFFEGVAHVELPWRDRTIFGPTFYYDLRLISIHFIAPLKAVSALLPSPHLNAVRVTPWHSAISIMAAEYRDSDIGPYNEMAIGIPVSLAAPLRTFTGVLWPLPTEADAYLLHLPVTTEIARDLGVEMAGFPKFLADIAFSEDREWVTCRASESGQHILTLRVRKGRLKPAPRLRQHPVLVRGGRLVRPLMIVEEHQAASSKQPKDMRLELGDHPIVQQLKRLPLGRPAACEYIPQTRAILTPVLETFAA